MTDNDRKFWAEEMEKCKTDHYYFYVNYSTVDGKRVPFITRDEFNTRFELVKKKRQLR